MNENEARADPAWWQIAAVLAIFAAIFATCDDILTFEPSEEESLIECVRKRGYQDIHSRGVWFDDDQMVADPYRYKISAMDAGGRRIDLIVYADQSSCVIREF